MSYFVFSFQKTDNGWELVDKTEETIDFDVNMTEKRIDILAYIKIRNIHELVPLIYLPIPFILLFFGLAIHYYYRIQQEELVNYIIEKYDLK